MDTKRTITQLLTDLFQEGQPINSITPQDLRDLIVTLAAGETKIPDPIYDDYLIPGFSIETGGAGQPSLATLFNGHKLYAFATNKMYEVFFVRHLTHNLKAGTDMTFHVHWTHNNATPTGAVKWNIDYTIARGYEAGNFSTDTTLSTIQTAGTQYAHHITNDDDMFIPTGVEVEPDSIIIGRVWRDYSDPEDTFNDNAFLLHFDIHHQIGQIGSLERNRPFTSIGF